MVSLKKRLFCLILAFLIFFVFLNINYLNAKASLLESTVVIGGVAFSPVGLAVATAALVAGGVYFATNEDARLATMDFLSNASSNVKNYFSTVQTTTTIAGAVIAHITNDAWQSVKDFTSSLFTGSNTKTINTEIVEIGGVSYTVQLSGVTFDSLPNVCSIPGHTVAINTKLSTDSEYYLFYAVIDGIEKTSYFRSVSAGSTQTLAKPYLSYTNSTKTEIQLEYMYGTAEGGYRSTYGNQIITPWKWDITGSSITPSTYAYNGDVSINDSNRDYVTVPENRGVVVDTAGNYAGKVATDVQCDVLNPDTPQEGEQDFFDSVTGTLTNIWDWCRTSVATGIGAISTTLTDVKTGILSIPQTISNIFTVESLDFSGLQNLVVFSKFPFCIPFDMVHAIELFAVSAQNPNFEIDIETEFLEVHHTIDLSPYVYYIGFFRYFVVIVFVIFLISKTSQLIKW